MTGVIAVPARPLAYADFWKTLECLKKPAGTEVRRLTIEGSRIDKLRNEACEIAMDQAKADWVLFLDDDHYVPENALLRLLDTGLEFVGAHYLTRTVPYRSTNMILQTASEEQEHPGHMYRSLTVEEVDSRQIIEVDCMGMGCTLIRRAVFERTPRAWFQMHWRYGFLKGEDVFFCEAAKAAGTKLYCDTNLRTPHITQRGVIQIDGGKVAYVCEADKWQ